MNEIRGIRAEIEQAITASGLGNDPLGAMMRAIASSCEVMTQASEQVVQAKRTPLDGDAVARIGQMVAESARKRTVELAMELAREQVRAHWRRDLAVVFGLLLAIGVAAFAGYREGWSRGSDTAHETQAGLREAFGRGGFDAAAWLQLMRWNHADAALALCKGQALSVQNGRKACAMMLWIEPPKLLQQPNG